MKPLFENERGLNRSAPCYLLKWICNTRCLKIDLFIFMGSGMCSAFRYRCICLLNNGIVIHTLNQAPILDSSFMATLLPRIFLMLFGGVLSDRYKRSTIMRISSGLRSVSFFVSRFTSCRSAYVADDFRIRLAVW